MKASPARQQPVLKPAKGLKKMEISRFGIAVAIACVFLFFALLFVMLREKPVEQLPPAEKTFMEKYSDFSGAWKENGVKAEKFNEALPELAGIGSAGIGKTIAALEQAKSGGDESIALLSDAYIDMAKFALAKKEHEAALAKVKKLHGEPTCETYGDYGRLNDSSKKMVLLAKDYSEKIKLFAEKFPAEAESLSLKAETFDWNAAEAQVAGLESAVEYFKGECGK
ncbi:MAG: hypothetical protein V1493_00610 [Candidatus Diapherotrites archaeon]